jgi:hypothetical protein
MLSTAEWDSTPPNGSVAPKRRFHVTLEGRLWPRAWDVTDTFGSVGADVSGFARSSLPLEPTLALRVGGKHVFGRYPFHEAAFLGGSTVRGLGEQRYAGDASAFANAELRLRLGRFFVLFPGEAGLFGLTDAGRVFVDGESSDRWHTGVGGGLWVAFLERKNTVSVAVAGAEGRLGVYVRAGLLF